MRSYIKILLVISVFILISNNIVNAQKSKGLNQYSVTLHGGGLIFYGDIQSYDLIPDDSKYINLGYGISVKKNLNFVFGLQANYLKGKLSSTDLKDYFNASFNEFSLVGNFNLSNLVFPKNTKERKLYIYSYIGAGLTSFRSIRKSVSNDVVVNTFGYDSITLDKISSINKVVFPVGIGFKYKISDKIDLGLETSNRSLQSDKLDSKIITNSKVDKYGYTSLTITYKIGNKKDSYDWVSPYKEIAKNNNVFKQQIMLLSRDTDYDGVVDYFDKEPNTPEGAIVDFQGKTLDTDGDKVPDYLDNEIYSNKGAFVDSTGVEIDTDKDGVPDSKDSEENTPEYITVNFQGKTIHQSGAFMFKGEGGITSNSACAFPSVYFDYNDIKIRSFRNIERLATIAQIMRSYPDLKLSVIGYADRRGDDDYNIKLSRKRAEAVVEHLSKKYLIDESRFIIEAKGSSEYLSLDENLNRRVDFEVYQK